MAIGGEGAEKRAAYVRLATREDVPIVKLLIESLAAFEKLSDQCHATEPALQSSLFGLPPFVGPTVFLLELAPLSSPSPSAQQSQHHPAKEEESLESGHTDTFQEQFQEVRIASGLQDSSSSEFRSAKDEARIVVGFVLFLPNYSTFLAKSGIHIEDLYVREAYRRQGLGTVLLTTVAQQAARRGCGRVEWNVLDWNVNAIKFYESMGAVVLHEWRSCRLAGDALLAYGK